MFWFLPFLLTGAVTALIALLYWLSDHNVPGAGGTVDTLLPFPVSAPLDSAIVIVLLQLGFFIFVRIALKRVVSYSVEPDEESIVPLRLTSEELGTGESSTAMRVGRMLQSDGNGWTTAFIVPLIPMLLLAAPLVVIGAASAAAWGMSLLLVITLVGVRRGLEIPIE